MNSTAWKDSVFFLTYDEAGGFFDHVKPATMPSPDGIKPIDLLPKDPQGDFTRTGFRLPIMIASPYIKPHYVFHQKADNTAILRFIEKRYNLPALTQRDLFQPDLTEMFDFTKAAWATPPDLTKVVQPADAPCDIKDKTP
jgi:phospholipase C